MNVSHNFHMLRIFLAIHGILILTAGVVLVIAPDAIPAAVGIEIQPDAYLLCYLLAAMEFGMASLSWGAMTIADPNGLRIILGAFIVWHAVSASLEIYASAVGLSGAIWANVTLRVLIVALLAYLMPCRTVALRRSSQEKIARSGF